MRFLIDEMFPPGTCSRLLEPDREVAAAAARENRALVTENVKDFAAEHDIVVVWVLKSHLTQHGMHTHLASVLDQWAAANLDPYVGMHWPKVER